MQNKNQEPPIKNGDPNYEPVYKGGTQPTFVEKGAAKPPIEEDVFDDCGRVLFEK